MTAKSTIARILDGKDCRLSVTADATADEVLRALQDAGYSVRPVRVLAPVSDDAWLAAARKAATAAGVSVADVVSGCRQRGPKLARWEALRALKRAGFTECAIARASGFHRNAIRYALHQLASDRKIYFHP